MREGFNTPKCPYCKEEIDYLNNYEEGENHYHFTVDDEGNVEYETKEFISKSGYNEYECPECQEIIAYNEEDAMWFLINGSKVARLLDYTEAILNNKIIELRNLRDTQNEIPCLDENECICNDIDQLIDVIEDAEIKTRELKEKFYKARDEKRD